jgi:SCY1-like protein 1
LVKRHVKFVFLEFGTLQILTAQLAPADMQTMMSSAADASISAPNINGRASSLPVSSASPSTNPSRGKGLQLGGNKAPTSTLAEEVANEAGQGSSRLWNDDLIDINADEGDWSMFLDL